MHSTTKYTDNLLEILLLDFPKEVIRPDTFMNIANVENHENTISHIYAYFLNSKKNQAIAELFLGALIEVVKQKKENFDIKFNGHSCYLEYTTHKGNRIDLVILSDTAQGKTHDAALIIENKIYSWVHNNLTDYYESVDAKNKMGVLLTLWKEDVGEEAKDYFVNILHSEWIEEIKKKGLPHNLTANEYVYLNDFLTNMENLNAQTKMNADAKFFFENSTKVIRATQTMDAAFEYIGTQLEIAAQKMEMEHSGSGKIYRHIWKKEAQVYYAIIIDTIVYGHEKTKKSTMGIYLEIYKDALRQETELREILKEHGVYEILADDKTSNSTWAHLAYKEYELDLDDIEKLNEFITSKIQSDFQNAHNLVASHLSKAI